MKNMKKLIISVVVLLASVGASLAYSASSYLCKDDEIMVKSTEFENKKITNIRVASAFEVRIIKTNSQRDNRIELNVSERVEPYVKVDLTSGNLFVRLEDMPKRFTIDGDECFLDIYTNEFNFIRGSGATDFVVVGEFDYNTLTLSISGASDIKFETDVNVLGDFKINGSGASGVKICNLNAKGGISIGLSGSSDVEVENICAVGDVCFNLTGASDICLRGVVNIDNKLNVKLSGSSDIEANEVNVVKGFNYILSGASEININSGECKSSCNSLSCSGASDYSAAGFVVNSMRLVLSGASSAKVNVLGDIQSSVSISASLRYKANEKTRVNNMTENIRSF